MNKRLTTILVFVAIACAIPCKALATSTNRLEAALRRMRTADLSVQGLGTIYKHREAAPNPLIRSAAVKACAAGLLYLGKNNRYNKTIRQKIPQVATFEKSLLAKCLACQGGGVVTIACKTCNGNGLCSNRSCRRGRARSEGFEGRVTYRKCAVCKGTGRCKKCGGAGKTVNKCSKCRGRGGNFSASVALAACREQIEHALSSFEALGRAEVDRNTRENYKARLRDTEVEARREAILVEAKASGQERARQAAMFERKQAEKRQKDALDAKFASFDKEYLKSIVVIEGDRGMGTGFLCKFKGKKVLFSNAHVLCGNRSLRLRTTSGKELKQKRILVCKSRDIVAYELENTEGLKWLDIHSRMDDVNNQEQVVVFGNSAGKGVVTTLRGKMQGIGPDKVEVDATFVQGNSGSPIIAYPYSAVIGMATYATREPQVDWAKRNTRFAEVRRFGVRIDNTKWSDFFTLDTKEYTKALDVFESIATFADTEVMKAQWQGAYYRATHQTKARARDLLQRYDKTPPWMRQYADDAALAAHICRIIIK